MKKSCQLPSAIIAVVVCFCATICGFSQHQNPTLATTADVARFASFQIEEQDFYSSCFAVEEIFQRKLANMEIANGRGIAKDLRALVGTARAGSFKIPNQGGTVREVLSEFARIWEVLVLIDGNTILFVDEADASRFRHDVMIKPRQ
jgi:hypothetical protein